MHYEVRHVALEDRGPIALFQLRVLEELGGFEDGVSLASLDRCDCLVLIEIDDEGNETVVGLAYLTPRRPEVALLLAFWTHPRVPVAARQQLARACDDHVRALGMKQITAFTRLPAAQVDQWEERYGYRRTGRVELVHEV